ncbi:sulfite exporter TauE/SafE [Alkalibacillus filiformis]|uniref:Sulfite exporter TauE/SafE n=1 Tax=Alkalibacillus filiformis TaxID=200990 RepID=A0ABU0DPI3_9BACI|nr:hypothetical protein [Alkalibacillus filiformis]MDQ0350363.1 sulfite exporter TauE/SafE [Alkalibacillus filiformis]
MLPRMVTYLLLGALIVAAVAVSVPQYLSYLLIAFAAVFVIMLGALAYIYGKRALLMFKELKKQ